MKILFKPIILILFLTPFFSNAQLNMDVSVFYDQVVGINISMDNNDLDNEKEVEGSPYEYKDFSTGKLVQYDNTSYNNIPLNYNIYEDRIEFMHKNEVAFYIDKPEDFKEIYIGNQKYIYRSFNAGKKTKYGYFEVLKEGKVSLLKKKSMNIKEAEPEKAYSSAKPARFIKGPNNFYLLKEDNKIYEVKSPDDVLSIINDQNEKLSSFIKKNKLKFKSKKEQNLTDLISFYNSL